MKNEKKEEINVLLDQVFSGIVPVQTSKMMIVIAIESLQREAYHKGIQFGEDKWIGITEAKQARKQLLDEIMEKVKEKKDADVSRVNGICNNCGRYDCSCFLFNEGINYCIDIINSKYNK